MKHNFIKCGIVGWCLEVIWTGLYSGFHHDRTLKSTTSLFMFPIYGMAAVIGPISRRMQSYSVWLRGMVYAMGIYTVEFATGSLLKKRGRCPWDYSACKHQIKGLIRLDYAPAWFVTGLIYEKILTKQEWR